MHKFQVLRNVRFLRVNASEWRPTMKIYTLIENTTKSDLACEHGLSLLIEYNSKKFLLDAGCTSAFMENACKMNLKLQEVDKSILSHGHYDHSGGFGAYLALYGDKKVYAMEDAKNIYYSGSGGNIHEIGIPKDILNEYEDRFIFVEGKEQIDQDIYLIPHSCEGLEFIGEKAKLYKLEDGNIVPDDFTHELSLVFRTKDGLVIFNSCSHAGLINIVNEVLNEFPNEKVYAYVGGLHMKDTYSEEEVKKISEYVTKKDIKKIFTGHCTGDPALEMLEKHLEERIERLYTGKKIEL